MPQIGKDNQVNPVLGLKQTYLQHFGQGMVATDGVVYSSVVTFGTADTEILNQLVDPGFGMNLDEVEVGLTQRFVELGLGTGTISYYWQIRSEGQYLGTTGKGVATIMNYYNMTGTYVKGVASAAASEDTFAGFLAIANVPRAPFRVLLTARANQNAVFTGRVKNSSFIQLSGIIIPGV